MKYYRPIFLAIYLLSFTRCTAPQKQNAHDAELLRTIQLDTTEVSHTFNSPGRSEDVVFYNLFSPLDLNKVIDRKSSYFNSTYINSLNNITKYINSVKIALNIGIYGTDLTYLWMFEQNQQALSYLSAIQHLTSKLGIPNSFVKLTVQLAENNSASRDSMIFIARQAYYATHEYLQESDKASASALILFGAWIETLNIALHMYTEPNAHLAAKIISQKYSLATLINMIQDSPDAREMSEYLLMMKKLNDSFKSLEAKLKPEDIEIDTLNKSIAVKDSGNLQLDPAEFSEIKEFASKIRQHIIE